MKRGIRLGALGFFLLALPCSLQTAGLHAQKQQKRPRVAVVLSGGGAKGMAHIGALKVIERAGIPIDIVTGTSMGSIVGGLYAVGYDAATLDSLVRMQDWGLLFSDKSSLRSSSLEQRERQNTYQLLKDISLKRNSLGVTGLIQGKNLSNLFNLLTADYADSTDFGKLPIPFACVATDIVTNEEYDFHSGYLAQAMRASMAIPGAFAPVRLGDKVLVDGGLRNNYPADIARQMGADIIIGVTVQGAPKTADDLGSPGSIISQIVDVNCKNKYDENLSITDIPIRVNTQGYGSASFSPAAIDTLIRRGEEEALNHWDELLALRRRLGITETPAVVRKPSTSPLPAPTAETTEERITQAGIGVRFDLEERVALQGMLSLPLPTKKAIDLDMTLRLGKRVMARAAAVWKQHSIVQRSLSYTFRRNEINFYDAGDKDYNLTYNQHALELQLWNFSIRNANLAIGARWDFFDYGNLLSDRSSSLIGTQPDDEHFFTYFARLSYNSENQWYFPTRGTKVNVQYAYRTDNFAKLNGKAGLSDVSAEWNMSITPQRRFTLQPKVYTRLLFGSSRPDILSNYVGGAWSGHYMEQQLPFPGIGHIERAAAHFAAVQLLGQQRIAENNYLQLRAAAAQHAPRLSDLLRHHTMLGIEAAYYYNTLLGPVGASVGYSNKTKKPSLFINIGFVF